jgi:iron complex outermembrane receptor protein
LDLDATRWVSGLSLGATYFNVNYRDRIQSPASVGFFLNDSSLSSLITRNPTGAQIAQACASGGMYMGVSGLPCAQTNVGAIIDGRTQNLASVRTSGVDLDVVYEQRWSPGTLRFRLDGTYLLDFTQQPTPNAVAMQTLNTQNNPINLKLHGLLTWQQPHWGATVGVTFQNGYRDTVSVPIRSIRSYTTFDAQLRYVPPLMGFLENTSLELNAINVFNSTPPFLNNATAGLGYDQENADPTGRLISIQVRKSW